MELGDVGLDDMVLVQVHGTALGDALLPRICFNKCNIIAQNVAIRLQHKERKEWTPYNVTFNLLYISDISMFMISRISNNLCTSIR